MAGSGSSSMHWVISYEHMLRELEQLMASSLGPSGNHKLVETGNKQVLCSSAGIDILSVVKPQHPVVAAAVKAAVALGEDTGGGVKRVLLMVVAGLRAAQPLLQGGKHPAAAQLCMALASAQPLQEAMASQAVHSLHCNLTNTHAQPCSSTLQNSCSTRGQAAEAGDTAAAMCDTSDASMGDAVVSVHFDEASLPIDLTGECTVMVAAEPTAHHHSPTGEPAFGAGDSVTSTGCDASVCAGSAHDQRRTSRRHVKRVLRALIMTQLCNRASVHVVRAVLAPLLTDLILAHLGPYDLRAHQTVSNHATQQHTSGNSSTGSSSSSTGSSHSTCHSLWSVIHSLAKSPPVHILPGQPVEASQLQRGLLLSQGLASSLMPAHIAPAITMVLACPLLPTAGQHQEGTVLVQSSSQYAAATAHAQLQLHRFLAHIKPCGVNLVLCTHLCSPVSTHVFMQHGIACAPLISTQDMRQACALLGTAPITCMAAALQLPQQQVLRHHVGHVPQARVTALAGQPGGVAYSRGLLLELEDPAATFIQLTGPSDGLCRQYRRMLADTLTCLATACQTRSHTQQPAAAGTLPAPGQTHSWQDLQEDVLQQHLQCIPGGCAFDFALARSLQRLLEQCRAGQPSAAAASIPLPALLAALPVWHAMACACPKAMLLTAYGQEHRTSHSNVLKLFQQLLAPAHTDASQLGLVCCSSSYKSRPTFNTYRLSRSQRISSQGPPISPCKDDDVFIAGNPERHGVLELMHHTLSIWSAATQLLLQLLRVDAVVAATRLRAVNQPWPMRTAGHARRVRRGQCWGNSSSEDETSSNDSESDSDS